MSAPLVNNSGTDAGPPRMTFHIDITFDFPCPWCYIGHRRLSRAIDLYRKVYPGGRNDVFQFHWHPFYLSGTASLCETASDSATISLGSANCTSSACAPSSSVSATEVLSTRFADQPERAAAVVDRLHQVGRSEGILFDFSPGTGMKIPRAGTRDVHRLVRLVDRKYGDVAAQALVEQLYHGIYEEGVDVGEKEELVRLAAGVKEASCGSDKVLSIDEGTIRAWMESDEGCEEIDKEAERARAGEGVTGVPTFVVSGSKASREALEGAHDVGDWLEVLTKIKQANEEHSGAKISV
ncbi:thioredoxin-like protein [Lineolata rhizophorae]|uniref:Thioredoxin-like protein n=1 Tax=Lineolata rhizophorae TaxID=578093 RepID=A0A6A6PCS8_9PEZI|nr:thioredoxin-like protein [Lineolata rhizophorae]